MPYKLSKTKKSVMVKKGGKWITLKTYKSEFYSDGKTLRDASRRHGDYLTKDTQVVCEK